MRSKKENIGKFLSTCKNEKKYEFEKKQRNGDEVKDSRISTVKITSDLIIEFPKLEIREYISSFNSLSNACIKAVKTMIKNGSLNKHTNIKKPYFLNFGDIRLFSFLLSVKRNELLNQKSKEKRDECIKWDVGIRLNSLIKQFEEKNEPRIAIDLIESIHSVENLYKFEKMSDVELKEKFRIKNDFDWNRFLSECQGKTVYENSQKAKHAAGTYEMVHHEQMNNYRCSFCGMFHIGHDNGKNEIKQKWKIKRRK